MQEIYVTMNKQLEALIEDNDYDISILSNAAAVIYNTLDELNWAGFYIMKDGLLKLGPFQGEVACVRIPVGRGVCGTAVKLDETQLVEDVHQFPGHIACDAKSNSEIVIPIHVNGEIYGVLDIDSPVLSRFNQDDKEGLEAFVKIIEKVMTGLNTK